MNLEKKKNLAARTLNVGRGRIFFNSARLDEIKEAITKQDIRDLAKDGAIVVKEVKGRKQKYSRKTRRRAGSIKKKQKNSKREYVILTRKLRRYLGEIRESLTKEKYRMLRKEIKAKTFRNKTYLKDRISQIKGESK